MKILCVVPVDALIMLSVVAARLCTVTETHDLAVADAVDQRLSKITVQSVDDDGLRELVVQTERATQMLQAVQAQVMTEMVDRTRREASKEMRLAYGDGHPEEFVVDELAVLLSCTKNAASVKLSTAWHARSWASTGRAWQAGRIDGRNCA